MITRARSTRDEPPPDGDISLQRLNKKIRFSKFMAGPCASFCLWSLSHPCPSIALAPGERGLPPCVRFQAMGEIRPL